jgi:hypothetical protein
MDLPSFDYGIAHSKFKGYLYQNTKKKDLPTVWSLVSFHRFAGWPGSILVTKVDNFRFQQIKVKVIYM